MQLILKQLQSFFSFEAVNIRIVLLTAFISYLLQINAIISGEPLYLIAFYTLLPWIPLCLFEGVWKVKNYAVVALLGLFTILQIGHFAEHLIQVLQIEIGNGTVACPPPIDNAVNAARGVALGLRDAAILPSFYSVESIIKPGAGGQPILGPDGNLIMGPAACAVFGQLDLEIVHLVWELFGLFGTALVLFYFRKNIFLWIAFAGLCWHALFITLIKNACGTVFVNFGRHIQRREIHISLMQLVKRPQSLIFMRLEVNSVSWLNMACLNN